MTPHDRYQRLIDLKGEIKRAEDELALSKQTREDKAHALAIADEHVEKCRGRLEERYQEARELGEAAKRDFDALVPGAEPVLAVGEPDDAGLPAWTEPDPEPAAGEDFDDALRQATERHLDEALDAAREPQGNGFGGF